MKIEKLNENQIRATLTKSDLEQRNIRLSELAYGTEKAQALFSEMIRYASYEYGFETDDSPMMVEAVPISSDSIVLILSKVSYPEELDTRFSNFSRSPLDQMSPLREEVEGTSDPLHLERSHSAREALDAARAYLSPPSKDAEAPDDSGKSEDSAQSVSSVDDLTRIFAFSSIDDLFDLANILLGFIRSDNTLYHIRGDAFYLILRAEGCTPETFNKLCNVASEYGTQCALPGGADHYFGEHRRPLLEHNALQQLATI